MCNALLLLLYWDLQFAAHDSHMQLSTFISDINQFSFFSADLDLVFWILNIKFLRQIVSSCLVQIADLQAHNKLI